MKFYRQEIIDIIIASFILSLSFAIVIKNVTLQGILLVSLIVVPSFLIHELAHKYFAQKYGYAALFVKFDIGLFIALLSSLFGFIFAAPGAVVIGNVRKKLHLLYISLAGPVTNILLSLMGLIAYFIFGFGIMRTFAYINAFLAFFNLFPIPPLDGFKIFSINKIIWIITILIAAILLFI